MEELLNKRITRIIIGVSLAIPFTAISIVLGWHGLLLGFGGIASGNVLFILIGITTIIGFVGITGAWRRLLKSSKVMSKEEQNKIRTMLFFGLASSFILCVWSVFKTDLITISILYLLLLFSVFFIYATPKKL